MTRVTKSFMGLGAYEAHFVSRPHLIDLFEVGSHIVFYDGEEKWQSGVITEPARLEGGLLVVSGPGPEWWLGETDKKGPVRSPRDYVSQTTDQIVTNLLLRDDATPALNPGTINVGNTIALFSIYYETCRRAIRRIASMTRTEYRVNPDFTFDWAGNTGGGKIGTTKDIILAKAARTVKEIEYEATAYDAAGKVIVLARGDSESMLVRTASQALPAAWKDWNNNPFQRDLVVDAPNANTVEEADFVAVAQAGLHAKISRRATVELKRSTLRREFDPGDSVYVYKPLVLEDSANAIPYKSRVYPGLLMRVAEVVVDPGPEWRVFHRSPTGVETDITSLCMLQAYTKVSVSLTSDPEQFLAEAGEDNPTDARREDQTDQTIPNKPTGLSIASSVYKDYNKTQRTRLTFQWTAPTLNTDGSALVDLARYVVRFRRVTGVGTDPWQTVEAEAGVLKGSVEDLAVGVTWEAQIQAEDQTGNVSGWGPTTPVNTLAAVDTTPPPQPKAAVITGGIGSLYVEWERKDSSNVDMPADVRWYEVHASGTSGFTPSPATLIGTHPGTLASFEAAAGTLYVKLIAVDNAGNKSASSAASNSATVLSVSGVPDYSIGGQQIAEGAISTDKTVFGDFYNLNDDPSFEFSAAGALDFPHNDDQFWSEAATAQVAPWEIVGADPTNSRTGKGYAKRVGNASDTSAYLYSVNRMPCRAGDEFFIEHYYKTSGTPDGTLALGMRWLDKDEAQISITNAATSTADPTSYTVMQGKVVAPANSAWCEYVVYVTGHTTGTYFVDDTFCHKTVISVYISDAAILTAHIALAQISTALIGDLQVTTGKIAALAVTDAKVANMVVDKLLAGSLSVTVSITSGLIRTDTSGARVEIDSDGINLFSPTGFPPLDPQRLLWWRDGTADTEPFFEINGYWTGTGEVAAIWATQQGSTEPTIWINAASSSGASEILIYSVISGLGDGIAMNTVGDAGIRINGPPAFTSAMFFARASCAADNKVTSTGSWPDAFPSSYNVPQALCTVWDPSSSHRVTCYDSGSTRTAYTVNRVNLGASTQDLGLTVLPISTG